MRTISICDARERLLELLEDIRAGAEPISIEDQGQVVAVLGRPPAAVAEPSAADWNSGELWQSVIDASPVLINFKDRDGRYIVVNAAHAAFYGMTPAELVGRSPFDHIGEDEARQIQARDREVMALETLYEGYEEEAADTAGLVRAFHTNKVPLRETSGRVAGVVTFSFEISQRKRVEEALRESEKRFRSVIDNTPSAIYLKDTKGRYSIVNRQFTAWYGYSAEQAIGRSTYDLFDKPLADQYMAIDREVLASGKVQQREVQAPFGDGELRWVLTTKFPVFGPEGDVLGVGTINDDITERKLAEEALKSSEALLARALRQTRLAYSAFESNSEKISEWSAEATEILGLAHDRLPRTHAEFHALIHPDDRDTVERVHRESRQPHSGESYVEYRILRPDGEVVWLRETAEIECDAEGAPVRGLSTIQDISAIRSAEEAVRMRDAWLRSIFEYAPMQIALKDNDGRMIAVSRNVADHFGKSRDDFIGRTTADFLPPDIAERYMAADRKIVVSGETIQQETVEEIDGERSYYLNSKFPMRNDTGHIVGVCSLTNDITELRETQEQLHQAQRMESIGQLTGGVAHDFNNLLAVIQGNSELLADRLGHESPHLNAIIRASGRGAELTQHLLAFSRRQPLRPAPIDVAELLPRMQARIVDSLSGAIAVTVSAAPGLWPAYADPRQVEAALMTLAVNASEAMPNGGRLSIDGVNANLDASYVEENPETVVGDYVEIAVSDNGHGMTAEVVEQAVEPFFTTKDIGAGSGLGLSMVYGFAKQTGGHIAIDSTPGAGTVVRLFLPRHPTAHDG